MALAARHQRIGRLSRIAALVAAAVVLVVSVTAYVVTRRQRDRAVAAEQQALTAKEAAEQALAEKREAQAGEREAQAGEAAANEAKAIIEKAKAEVEQMKRREEYYSAIAQAARRIEDRHFEIAETLLLETPSELRHWEWGRLMYLCHPELLTIRPQPRAQAVSTGALSPDGQFILTVARGGASAATLWDAATGREVRRFAGPPQHVLCAAFSPDGTRLLTSGAGSQVRLWDSATGKELRSFRGGNEDSVVWGVCFSADGTRAATGCTDKTARILDVSTGGLLGTLAHPAQVLAVAFSADGKRLATGAEDGTHLWEIDAERDVWRGKRPFVRSVAFSPDGSRLLTASEGGQPAVIHDVADGRETAVFWPDKTPGFLCSSFSPDGKQVVSSSLDHTARIWDASTGKELAELAGHGGPVRSAHFFPDGKRILTAAEDNTVRIWEAHGQPPTLALPAEAHMAAYTPDGTRIITVGGQGTMIWEAATGRLLQRGKQASQDYAVAQFADGKRLASVSVDGQVIRLWDLAECRETGSFSSGFDAYVHGLTLSRDGKYLAGASPPYGVGKVWDPETRKDVAAVANCMVLAFCPDGRLLGNQGIHDPLTGQCVSPWPELGDMLSAAFSPDGRRLLTGHFDKTARLWDWETRVERARLRGHAARIWAVAFSPDGRRLVTGSEDRTAKVWDADTGRDLCTLYGTSWIRSVSFAPDGRQVLTAGSGDSAHVYAAVDWRLSPEELEKTQGERYQKWLQENGLAAEPAAK
jgi:WD40 repeat protein